MRKGQVSVEMVVLLCGLVLMAMLLVSSLSSGPERSMLNQRSISAKEYCEKLAYDINNIFLAGEGATASVSLPSTLDDGTNYTINLIPGSRIVEIRWNGLQDVMQYQAQLVTSGISGALTNISGNINLSNPNGTIVLTR